MGESEADSDGLMFPGDENEETEERLPPEEIQANREQEDFQMVSFEVEDELHQTKEVQTQNNYSDSWLANVRYSPDRTLVSFEFARYARCISGKKYKYSHHPDDVAKHNALKVLERKMALRFLEKQPRHREAMQTPIRTYLPRVLCMVRVQFSNSLQVWQDLDAKLDGKG